MILTEKGIYIYSSYKTIDESILNDFYNNKMSIGNSIEDNFINDVALKYINDIHMFIKFIPLTYIFNKENINSQILVFQKSKLSK